MDIGPANETRPVAESFDAEDQVQSLQSSEPGSMYLEERGGFVKKKKKKKIKHSRSARTRIVAADADESTHELPLNYRIIESPTMLGINPVRLSGRRCFEHGCPCVTG